VGVVYAAPIVATGGTPPYTFTGTAPAGLTVNSGGAVSGTPTAAGTFSVSVTVTDSAAQTAAGTVSLTVTPATAPGPLYSLWLTSTVPGHVTGNDSAPVELGTKWISSVAGQVVGLKFYKATNSTGTHTGTLWNSTGGKLATGTYTNETASGWQTLLFTTPVMVTAGTSYTVSYHTIEYVWDSPYFNVARSVPPLSAPVNAGVYAYGNTVFPTSTYQSSNYYADILFLPAASVVGISIAPLNPTIVTGGSVSFSAVVTNTNNTAVTWSANAPGGTYTAPPVVPSPPTATVTVSSVADPTKSASTTVTITPAPPPPLTISCPVAAAGVSGLQTGNSYSITVTGGSRTASCTGVSP
jgi:hypothetical protein